MNKLSAAQRANQAGEDYTKLLIEMSQYSGNKKSKQRIYSASSLGSEPLQVYLSYIHGKSDKAKFGANTIGTIYQLGCDSAISMYNQSTDSINKDNDGFATNIEYRYQSAIRIKRELPNGWTISGEIDQIDHKMKVIIDNKVISGSAYKEIIKNSRDHDYNLQQGVYQWLLEPQVGRYESILSIINKGGAAIRNDIYTTLHLDTHPSDVIEAALIAETDVIQYYIDNETFPPRCDIFKYGKTKDVPNRCALYCDHNHHCPHYSDYKREKDIISSFSMI